MSILTGIVSQCGISLSHQMIKNNIIFVMSGNLSFTAQLLYIVVVRDLL